MANTVDKLNHAYTKFSGELILGCDSSGKGGLTTYPMEFSVAIQDVDLEATRNSQGNMKRNRVNVKRKLTISYGPMSTATISAILKAVSDVSFYVKYFDPQTGGMATKKFYTGDRSAPVYSAELGIWKECSFDLVEI